MGKSLSLDFVNDMRLIDRTAISDNIDGSDLKFIAGLIFERQHFINIQYLIEEYIFWRKHENSNSI